MVQRRERGQVGETAPHPGWSLRRYMAVFMAVLLAVAVGAALAVRGMTTQDAQQAADGDANFAARTSATEIAHELALLQRTTTALAANPQVAVVLATAGASCALTYSGGIVFSIGRLEIVTPDGSVNCSSDRLPTGPVYGTASWLPVAVHRPLTAAPYLDPITNLESAVVAAPVGDGLGAVVAIVALTPVGPNLAASLGGARQLEFLITTSDTHTVLARSLQPSRWVGTKVAGTSFASSAGPIERRDLDGTTRIYGRFAVPSTAWTVFAGADEAAAMSAANEAANRSFALILVGAGIMFLATFVVYRRIAEPVRQLSHVMRGSTPGKAVNAIGRTGASEVAALAEDFDLLMSSVKHELAERLNSEHTAMISERNYRMLFEGNPQPMWLYDVHTLAFLKVNDAAVEQYGYSRDEFLAMTVKDIRPPEDVPKFLELIESSPTFDRTGPWLHRYKDGSTVQTMITSHALRFGKHDARYVLAEDLSESRRLEMELAQSLARAESAAELSLAKDEMVSIVSHEMRTPLASIVGFAELMVTREVTARRRKEYLGVMLQEGLRLTSLINDFLDLRRIEGGHQTMRFAPADLSALIKRAIDLTSDSAGSPIETRLPNDLPLVRVDSDSIFRVLTNLLSNARKYSPNGGTILVGAGVVEGMVEVYVQDEGLGIPGEALPQVFDKFFRVNNPDRRGIKGTGLGLSISKNIVEVHGGKIGVRSKGLGQGSLFHFTIPLARERAQTGDVLVVEDDSGFAQLLEAELTGQGLTSIWASDAETAEHLTAKVRAIVLDLMLPGITGEAFLSRLRARHGSGIPVVVVTLKDLDPPASLRLQQAGVTAVLRKGPGTAATAARLLASSLAAELVAS
ncbi:MAG: ATP-binding protein [Candidatus Dormibacteraeota bacterium]|nr:ATP-binding protein [Candidatus Dormibacteraeota bacterium]